MRRSPRNAVLLIVPMIAASTNMAYAEMQVIDSNVPEMPVGTKLSDDAAPKLPCGGIVKVLLGSGKIRTMAGPVAARSDDPIGAARAPNQQGSRCS